MKIRKKERVAATTCKRGQRHYKDDEEYVLTLEPFTKTPKINFGSVKANNEI